MNKWIVAVAIVYILYLVGSYASSPQNASKAIQPYQAQAAKNFEEQYNQVKQHGTQAEICVRAGLVAEGYLQARDNVNFAKWADIKSAECKKAGMSL